MMLGMYETRNTRRRRFWGGVFRWMTALAFIVGTGVYAYEYGAELAGQDMADYRSQMEAMSRTSDDLRQKSAQQRLTIEEERARLLDLQERYDRDIPLGDNKDIINYVARKLESGVDPERLKLIIATTEKTPACDKVPLTKSFSARTALSEGANGFVRFAKNAITITAEGQPILTPEGKPEVWFEPAEPVKIIITHIGGEKAEVSGKLPLHHSMIVGDRKYRFTMIAGDKGFVDVTMDSCRHP